ncbi:MAG: phage distal tail protein, Rcc01695 family [Pikeienuella sp.]
MNFHEVLFPADLSFGSTGGPERRTEIVTLASGFEERNSSWAHSRRRFDAGLGVRSLDNLHEVIEFYEARLGQLYGFRWKDWSDCKSCPPLQEPTSQDQQIGFGDGQTIIFEVGKTYSSGPGAYVRPITKLVDNTVRVGIDGQEMIVAQDFTVNHDTGEISFATPPDVGAIVSAGFEFHVPVRFDTERIEVSLSAFGAGEAPSVPVVEVRI